MKFKYLLVFLSVNLIMICCAQKQDVELNKKQNINYRNEGMLFKLKYEYSNCSFEILVNDMPVVTHFGLGERSGLTVDINQYILKQGIQNVSIRMFPMKTDETSFATNLAKDSLVKVVISKNKEPMSMLDQINAKGNNADFKWEVLNYQTPPLQTILPSVEYKTTFEVEAKDVNWKIIGWSKSQDLQSDPNIRKEVDAFYADFKKTLEDGNQNKYQSLLKNSIYEEAASIPWNKQAESQLKSNQSGYATEKRNFIYPCKNAELKFYGNGKVVTLVCSDPMSYGYSPLISKTAKNMMPKSHTFYLHKPKGNDKLEIIR